MADASKVQEESDRKAKEKAAQKRSKRLAGMLADPERTLRKTEELVAGRGRDAYHEIATLLAELREVLAGTEQAGLAERQARKLREQNPTLRVLVSELRGKGFLPK